MELESSIYSTQIALPKWEKWFRLIKSTLQQWSLQKERKMATELTEKEPLTLKDVFICFCGPSFTWSLKSTGEIQKVRSGNK